MKRVPLLLLLALALLGCAADRPGAPTARPGPTTTAGPVIADSPSPQVEAGPTEPAPPTTASAPPASLAIAATAEPVVAEPVVAEPGPPPAEPAVSSRCGGSLPPCWVLQRESGGGQNNYNPSGCGGRGCYTQWQFDPLTWAGVAERHPDLGLPTSPADASYAEADDAAVALWDGGNGCSHWAAC